MPEPAIPADPQERARWITERRELCDKATPGPLVFDGYNTITGPERQVIAEIPDHPRDDEFFAPEQIEERGKWYTESAANAKFLVVARTDLPLLLDEIARLDGEINRLKAALSKLRMRFCKCGPSQIETGNDVCTACSISQVYLAGEAKEQE